MNKNKQNDISAMTNEHWFQTLWRPAIGWAFVLIILFDFVVAPGVTFALIKAGYALKAWVPLTLDANGFFYLGVGSILTMTSYTRGQEKVAQLNQLGKVPYDNGSNPGPDDPGPPL